MTEGLSGIDTATTSGTAPSLYSSIKSRAGFLISWLNACADYYAAAAIYEQLSKLSDAELRRRGLSRDTLVRDAFQRCDRTAHG
jgi:hypothetical protein